MKKIRIAGAAAGAVLVSGIVLQVSSAAFTGETTNSNNSWAAGTVALTNDLGATAMYASQANIVPGYSETRCIEVTYTGSVVPAQAVALGATVTSTGVPVSDDGLADDLQVAVQIGPAASRCNDTDTGFVDVATGLLPQTGTSVYATAGLNAFPAVATPSSTGWTPGAAGDMRPFLFTVTLPDATTPNDAQGDSADALFTWSATS